MKTTSIWTNENEIYAPCMPTWCRSGHRYNLEDSNNILSLRTSLWLEFAPLTVFKIKFKTLWSLEYVCPSGRIK